MCPPTADSVSLFIILHISFIILILQLNNDVIQRQRRVKTIHGSPLYKCATVWAERERKDIRRRHRLELLQHPSTELLLKEVMETLTTASSTLSLDIIDSDSTTAVRVENTRRGSTPRLVRTYSNCSYTLGNTFRHTAECRASTLPAVRTRKTPGGSSNVFPVHLPLPPTPVKKVAPRNDSHTLELSVREECNRGAAMYALWNRTEEAPVHSALREETYSHCRERNLEAFMEPSAQVGCTTRAAVQNFREPPTAVHKGTCIVKNHQSSISIGHYNNHIRLHPPVGHKVASYV